MLSEEPNVVAGLNSEISTEGFYSDDVRAIVSYFWQEMGGS